MRRNLILFAIGCGFFLFFVFFSYLVHKDLFTQIDFDTTVRLQNNVSRRFDDLFSLFSDIGSFELMLIFLVVLLVVWRKVIAGVMLFSAFVAFHIFELFGKYFVDHPPPPEFMLRTKRIVQFDQFHVRTEFSYPSGHSGRTLFVAVILLFIIWQMRSWPLYLKVGLSIFIGTFVSVMLVSRVYLGEHWMTDVIGGSLLGVALSVIGLAFYRKKGQLRLNRGQHFGREHHQDDA